MSTNSVAVVGPNEIAVADTSGCRVLLYDLSGKLIRQWGKYGNKGPFELHAALLGGDGSPGAYFCHGHLERRH